ncbi:MAG: hypothetical protein ACYCSA_09430 [Thermoplasmataceae archaeon]
MILSAGWNEWDDDSVRTALKHAYVEVEGETLKNLGDRDLLILASLIKNQDTNRAYSEVSALGNILPERELPTEFRSHYSDKEEDR